MISLDSGGYFALQGLDIGPIIEIPLNLSRIQRKRLKCFRIV